MCSSEFLPPELSDALRVAHVLCVDIVKYTLFSLQDQIEIRSILTQLVRDLPTKDALIIDTGDGFSAVFEHDVTGPLICSRILRERLAGTNFQVRMGIHSGPIFYQDSVTGNPNVTGPGINFAQRVMSLADGDMILLSAVAADLIRQIEPGVSLTEFGETTVKHGKPLRVFALETKPGVPEPVPVQIAAKAKRIRTNLPTLDREFMGRRSESDLVRKLLGDDRRRMVTVTGAGGIGKTTLAIQVADRLAPQYADGVWLVECEDLENPDQFVPLVASTLGSNGATLSELVEFLKGQQLLLVLDCLERITGVAPLLDTLLRDTRELQILATSRVLLSCRRETHVVLGPLDTERNDGEPSDALKLFCDAAEQVFPDFALTSRNRKMVDKIIAATEGVPIHLLLAAGKLRYMSIAELADRLAEDPLDTLKRKAVGVDRHASSFGVLNDSFQLLGINEQQLLKGLTVFRGGFFLVDAAIVLSSFTDVEGGIDELRNYSLLNASVVHGRTRFRCFDLVSEYLVRQVEPEWISPLAKAHAEYFAARSRQVRDSYDKGAWSQVQAVFWSDLANYRQAIRFALAHQDQDLIIALGSSLARVFMESGLLSDFRELAQAVEKAARERPDQSVLIEILGLMGGVERRDQNIDAAISIWMERIELCRVNGELDKAADGWLDLIDIAYSNNDFDRFAEYLGAFEALAPSLRDRRVIAQGLTCRALYLAETGVSVEPRKLLKQAIELMEQCPPDGHEFYIWQSIARVCFLLGEGIQSLDICLEWLPKTLAAKQRSSAGLFLLRIHEALAGLGLSEQAGKALNLVLALPKSISVKLRQLAKTKSEEFEAKFETLPTLETQNETAWNNSVRDLLKEIQTQLLRAKANATSASFKH